MAPLVGWYMCGQDKALFRGNKCNPSSSLNINSHFPEFHILSCPRSSGLYFKSVQFSQFSQFSSVSSVASPFHLSFLVFFNKKYKSNELLK